MIARILGGKFGVYIVGGTALLAFTLGWKVCGWQHGAAETVQVKSQIKETHAAIERVTREGRHVEEEITERRRDADRDVRASHRDPSLDRAVDDCVSRVLVAALNREAPPTCESENGS